MVLLRTICLGCLQLAMSQQNPPVWPSTVRVFSPGDADIQSTVDAAYAMNGGSPDHGQFSDKRYAFLFKPGTYNVEVKVGYYTQVAGLGEHPSDVVFASGKGVWCPEGTESVQVGSLNTFWRAAENFHTKADYSWFGNQGMMWAASQAAPVRRVIVENNLVIFMYRDGEYNADFASGGYVSNSQVKGSVLSGSEQQYYFRNCELGDWNGGVWNMVFSGTTGAPSSHCSRDDQAGTAPITTVDNTPLIAEKPFISIDSSGKYSLNVPNVRTDSQGVDFDSGKKIDFANVFVADDSMTAAHINEQLSAGMHVVMAPGIYHLEASLELNHQDQVLLGLGIATLIASNGQPAIKVGNVDGVRVAGFLLEAGSKETEALLVWGDDSHYAGNPSNPGVLSDVPMRVGGPVGSGVTADAMLKVNSGHVIGDDLWLWRADHTVGGQGVVDGNNPCKNAIIVNGDDVHMHGLMVEHVLEDLVQWNGERGATFMMQSELPYDVTQSYGDQKFAGYHVMDSVQEHKAYGVGVYHFFRDYPVVVETAIRVPAHLESSFINPVAVYLNGKGTVNHILNEHGESTSQTDGDNAVPKWWCPGGPSPTPTPTPPAPTPTPTPVPTPTPPAPTPAPTPTPATCNVGDSVQCPGETILCGGDQCCQDGTTCPSAHNTFTGCPKPKTQDCTGGQELQMMV